MKALPPRIVEGWVSFAVRPPKYRVGRREDPGVPAHLVFHGGGGDAVLFGPKTWPGRRVGLDSVALGKGQGLEAARGLTLT